MKPYPILDLDTARNILDFSGGRKELASLGEVQLRGAVALYNMINTEDIGLGYLADEVGMGKTYIALGVVALMRYFNPSLRVLYICPSANVQDKWLREHGSFIDRNVCTASYRVRTPEGKPAAPVAKCDSLEDLIRTAASGFYADFFVRNGSFSFGLKKAGSEYDEEAIKSWKAQRKKLQSMVPAFRLPNGDPTHRGVKDEFARALNYVLPTFDLVVIDESHNFKHNFESSDRNRVLSQVMGFYQSQSEQGGPYQRRVRNALLLSATPYDRNLEQLRNQLALVGKDGLLSNAQSVTDKEEIARFMVRRLNRLKIGDREYTRNMYRVEWRDGPKAAIELATDEQKLVTALVQKKVGDALGHKHGSPSFQMGMLASFESYGETTRSPRVEFDSEDPDDRGRDAQDRNVVGAIVDSYVNADLGRSLPHPKMDTVAKQLANAVFQENRKQLVFVRRVKSVKELKQKLDECYDDWLINYLKSRLKDFPKAWGSLQGVIEEYREVSRYRDERIDEGVSEESDTGEAELRQPPKNDNLFNWFFRGESPELRNQNNRTNLVTPYQVKQSLSLPKRLASPLLDINWVQLICFYSGVDLRRTIEQCLAAATEASLAELGQVQPQEYLRKFRLSQLFFLNSWVDQLGFSTFTPLRDHLRASLSQQKSQEDGTPLTPPDVREQLCLPSLFSELEANDELKGQILPSLGKLLGLLTETPAHVIPENTQELLRTIDIHSALVSTALRTGHGMIDLYVSRLRQGEGDLSSNVLTGWIKDFVLELSRQSRSPGFSTYRELKGLADELPAILKANLPGIFDLGVNEYRRYLSNQLSPIAPVIGATGETNAPGQRSAQARKFRMPGYPRVLVSTNVFQEGEDLHLFCDSVVHYGVSGSPVSIEQKNGRVDRVGSLAQRRLTNGSYDNPDDDDLIQVSFPHVKESIERVQIRRLSESINRYMASLHEIGNTVASDKEEIGEAEIADRTRIEPQIKDFLESPFDPADPRSDLEHLGFLKQQIRETQEQVQANVDQAKRLIASSLGVSEDARFPLNVNLKVSDLVGQVSDVAEVRLTTARASGEILARIVVDHKDGRGMQVQVSTHGELATLMHQQSWTTLHRTFAYQTAKNVWRLAYDAEMLVGDEIVTVERDMTALLDRFHESHDPQEDQLPGSVVFRHLERLRQNQNIQVGEQTLKVEVVDSGRTMGLRFWFAEGEMQRSQTVLLSECGGQCIFISSAVPSDVVSALAVEKIVELTWERNRSTDVVEFMLNDSQEIVGRCVHPVDSLHWREFVYCAHVLAVESDRLEYLVCEADQF
ncbi:DEAD/DEAH box helicase [Marinobacter sp. DS40M6]|uniref:DEAD/DEAH box helicase n=1 Tax=Marinobacter sp. DS40M6 TaxID=1597776 RepID=UPI0023581D3A|nr:DEAD/DEAH box helicase [Marinobacter sp. DS40M6]MDC8454697.1 DEAD/DEAH box helicase family protein [Marinobacter sp. DS40M6]